MKGGMPAPAIFAGGISRHGDSCSCRSCSMVRSTDAIDDVFVATRAAVVEHVGGEWSPAQHARRSS